MIFLPGAMPAPDPAELTVVPYYYAAPTAPALDVAPFYHPDWYPPLFPPTGGLVEHTNTVSVVTVQPLPPFVGGHGSGPAHKAPEIDPSGAVAAVTMLALALAVLRGRRR